MKNTQPIKTGKEPGITYYLGCKDYTHNFKRQEVKIINKVPWEKSNCVFWQSSKSRLLEQKHNHKK